MKKLFVVMVLILCSTFAWSGQYREDEFQSIYQFERNGKVGFKNQMTLPLTYGDQYLQTGLTGGLRLLKIYIPPGASALSFFCYVTQGSGYVSVAVARFRVPPAIDSSWPASKDDLAGVPNEAGKVVDATGKDYIVRSSGGYLDIINDYGVRINTEGEAGWLYIITKTFSPQSVISTSMTEIVRSNIYLPWFGSKTDWLPNGDPVAAGQTIPTPTPVATPVATPIPTPVVTPVPGCGPTMIYLGDFGTWMWESGKWVRH